MPRAAKAIQNHLRRENLLDLGHAALAQRTYLVLLPSFFQGVRTVLAQAQVHAIENHVVLAFLFADAAIRISLHGVAFVLQTN